MYRHYSWIRVVASRVLAFWMTIFFATTLTSDEKTYSPNTSDETDVLSLVLRSELVANKLTDSDLICFSVGEMNPSPKLVKTIRQQKLNVCSSAEWSKKFNCGFEVRIQFISLDASRSARVRAKVQDLREINAGKGDLAVLVRDGEYAVRKIDGKWSISDYIPRYPTKK